VGDLALALHPASLAASLLALALGEELGPADTAIFLDHLMNELLTSLIPFGSLSVN
jgi:hypothetical protein